jgi:hypothetical protein
VLTCTSTWGCGITERNTLKPDMKYRSSASGSIRSTAKPSSPSLVASLAAIANEIVFTPLTANTRPAADCRDRNRTDAPFTQSSAILSRVQPATAPTDPRPAWTARGCCVDGEQDQTSLVDASSLSSSISTKAQLRGIRFPPPAGAHPQAEHVLVPVQGDSDRRVDRPVSPPGNHEL